MSSARMTIEGFAADPRQRVTNDGTPILDVSVAHTPRRRNKASGEWEDVVDRDGNKITTWARGSFFGDHAMYLATVVSKGALVRLEGEPRLNVYTDGQGQAKAGIDLNFPSIYLVPRPVQEMSPVGGGQAQQQWQQQQDGQAGFGSSFDDQSPF